MRTELDIWNLAFARVGDYEIALDAAKTVTAATAANPVVCTSASHGYASGDLVLLADFDQMTQVNLRVFEVTVLTANTFSIPEDGTGYTAETGGGTARRLETGKHVRNTYRQWPIVRDEMLRLHPWNCAEKIARLARLQAAKTITGATQANPVVITANAHGYSSGDEVLLDGLGGMVELNTRWFPVTVLTVNTFSIPESGLLHTAYTSGGTARKALPPLRGVAEYDYRYSLPTDYVRGLELIGSRLPWKRVGAEVYTDEGPTAPFRYVYRVKDPNQFDDQLLSLLVARLAVDLAPRFDISSSKRQELRDEYERLARSARGTDAQEGGADEAPAPSTWEEARL